MYLKSIINDSDLKYIYKKDRREILKWIKLTEKKFLDLLVIRLRFSTKIYELITNREVNKWKIIFETEKRQGNCRDNEEINNRIFTWELKKFIILKVNWTILWHIKLKWENTFISYSDKKLWASSLNKWWIYTVDNYKEICKSKRVKDQYIYVCNLESMNVNFLRQSEIENFDTKVENHLSNIEQSEVIEYSLKM